MMRLETMLWSITAVGSYVGSLLVLLIVVPPMIILAIIVGYFYVRLSAAYLACSRELRRLESVSKSPIYSHFGETLHGIITIRVFGKEVDFMNQFYEKVDQFQHKLLSSIKVLYS
jgi:ABC-type transport system involved in cytochrome bd biosynthesis fused ATPase/permease subunit